MPYEMKNEKLPPDGSTYVWVSLKDGQLNVHVEGLNLFFARMLLHDGIQMLNNKIQEDSKLIINPADLQMPRKFN